MIRRIDVSDVPVIIDLLLNLKDESPTYNEVMPNIEYVSQTLTQMIEADGFIGCMLDNIGCMFGMVSRTWYSAELNGYEHLLYVLPEHRGRAAIKLVHSVEDQARQLGAHYMHVGTSTGIKEARTTAMYIRLGYELFGGALRKEIASV